MLFKNQSEREPENEIYQFEYLKCLQHGQRFAEIEEVAWDEVAISPHTIEYWELLINVYLEQDRFDETIHIANLGLSKNPNNQTLESWCLFR